MEKGRLLSVGNKHNNNHNSDKSPESHGLLNPQISLLLKSKLGVQPLS